MKPTLSFVFIVLVCLNTSRGQDPVLTPLVLTDAAANTADSNSSIVWSPISSPANYKTDESGGDIDIPFYNMADGFVDSVMPTDVPSNLAEIFTNDQMNTENIYEALKEAPGYMTAVIIGVLFIVVFPVIGLIFCCCRCCGKCGGKMLQLKPSSPCRRRMYIILFLVLASFTLAGCVCIFVINERMSSALDNYDNRFSNDVDDIPNYINNGFDQLKRLMDTDVNFAVDVLLRDVNNLDVLVGLPLRDKLQGQLNVSSTQLDSVPAVVAEFDAAKQDITKIQTAYTIFENEITNWKVGYSSTKSGCTACSSFPDENRLNLNFNANTIDISSSENAINVAKDANLTGFVDTALNELKGIPAQVKSNAIDLEQPINDFQAELTSFVSDLEGEKNKTLNSIDLPFYKSKVNEYTELIKPYEQYRWYAGIATGSVILLIVLLQFLGLIFGVCGSSANTLPGERSRLSNIGGNMLMASVGFTFIFGAVFMLVTTAMFAIGAPADQAVCPSSQGKTSYSQLLQSFGVTDPLAQQFKGVTIDDVLSDCSEDKSIYKALKLDENTDLLKSLNYTDKLDLKENTKNITVDLDTATSSIDSGIASVTDVKSNVSSLDFTSTQSELAKDITGSDFNGFLTELSLVIDGLSASTTKTDMENHRDNLILIRDGSYNDLVTTKGNLTVNMDNLTSNVAKLKTEVDALESILIETKDSLSTNSSAIVQSVVDDFIARLYRVADSLLTRAVNGLENEVASCRPLYNTFQSLVGNGVCKSFLGAWNSFWFSTGWCTFFLLPNLVLGVKLAKHFRRMSVSYDDEQYLVKMPKKTNKVSSSDGIRPASQSFSLDMKSAGKA